MKKLLIAAGVFVAVFVLLVLFLIARGRTGPLLSEPASVGRGETTPIGGVREEQPGFLFGRITTIDGATYQGRLRWGGSEEAFWGDYFNGDKKENPWLVHVPPEKLPKRSHSLEILWFKIGEHEIKPSFDRLFMSRFGDIARIEAHGKNVRVKLKSGTVFDLERHQASDFDDGIRVWDETRGVVDLDSLRISTIELLPTAPISAPPVRLHGTVRTRHADFTGFIQWDRNECVGTDELEGETTEGEVSFRYDTMRSIERRSRRSALVTLSDGREVLMTPHQGDPGNRGIYVDDRRYGRVLVSWDAFGRLDFSPGGSGPAYGDFPAGRKLTGSVTTRDGRRLAGRLVYDLDESETTETLDAPSLGVDYTIPFGMIASITPGTELAQVTLKNGEELRLDSVADLGERNAGILVFADGELRPEYLPWADVARIELDHPPEK